MKCQVCNGAHDLCDSDNDNGESKECPLVYASCYYNTNRDNKETTRSCGPESSKNVSPLEEVISVVLIPIIATETGNVNVAFRQISKIPQVQPSNLQLD